MTRTGRIRPAALAQLAGAVALLGGSWPVTRHALLLGAGPAWFALGLLLSAAWLGELLTANVLLRAGLVLDGAVAALPERQAVPA